MIPRHITAQVILSRPTWDSAMEAINDHWNQGYYITDFDYGAGYYKIVMSMGTGWNGQAVKYGKSMPMSDIKLYWDLGYIITNIMHDGCDWIVVMSGVNKGISQTWLTRTDWDDLKNSINEGWDEGLVMTQIACDNSTSTPVYCAVLTQMPDAYSQRSKFFPGAPTCDILDISDGSNIITDIYDVDGGVLAIAASGTGWNQQAIAVKPCWDEASDFIKRYWDKHCAVTTICYYRGDWIVVMSK